MRGGFVKRLSIFIVLLLALSCGSSGELDGEYLCIKNYSDAMVGKVILNLEKGGKVVLLPLNSHGTYSIEGDKVVIELKQFNLTFKIDGNKLVSENGAAVYEKR